MRRRTALTVAAVCVAFGLWTSTAGAAVPYRSCTPGKYLLVDNSIFPGVGDLEIRMRKAKADGYAPRCLVADAVAGLVQAHVNENVPDEGVSEGELSSRVFPRKVKAMGARWYVGTFRCKYRWEETVDGAVIATTCKHKGSDAATVRFVLTS